ncbi:hypothetical protein PATSB16_18530 [Pandoraea thiooxydans]|uniref:Uncharacterized protein n=1 Tax=Pandoraea thiooxydans TaxID=445709 RepID=A0A0G3ETH5_9BURK|nr:hypothetical protein [Pandoraea thiooxydans]AKJ67976.1 hypothetical protein ABW99_06845 [Pandoraea thiooxydans]APR95195.1 hypothetical protein PATSB16_18530 [Pandoraea thiooxydans]
MIRFAKFLDSLMLLYLGVGTALSARSIGMDADQHTLVSVLGILLGVAVMMLFVLPYYFSLTSLSTCTARRVRLVRWMHGVLVLLAFFGMLIAISRDVDSRRVFLLLATVIIVSVVNLLALADLAAVVRRIRWP